jgi:hypothetical protein
MLQQCSSASMCMQTHIVIGEHYTICQHSMLYVLNGQPYAISFSVLQYASDVILVPYWMNFTISTLCCLRKQVPSAFWQAEVCLNFYSCFMNVCASTTLTALWFQHSQMNPRFLHLYNVTEKFIAIFVGIALKNLQKPKPYSALYTHPWVFSDPILCKNL